MSLLTLVIIVSSVLFTFLAFDLYHRKKLTLLHFTVFGGGAAVLILFSIKPSTLDQFGGFFGIARGADAVVYSTIILLMYLFFLVLNKQTRQEYLLSELITKQALHERNEKERKETNDSYGFLIRAYNEEKTITKVIKDILMKNHTNIIIANDGSNDQTKEIIKKLQNEYPEKNIILLNHLINRGAGAANKTLFTFAQTYGDKYKISRRFTLDADGQMDINDLEKFEKISKTDQFDVVLGSRFVKNGNANNIPRLRKYILKGSRVITYLFNGIRTTDPHNGYRMISNEAIKKIKLESDGMTYASELLESIHQNKVSYTEIGVNIHYTDHTLQKGQKNSNALKILWELVYKKTFYK